MSGNIEGSAGECVEFRSWDHHGEMSVGAATACGWNGHPTGVEFAV